MKEAFEISFKLNVTAEIVYEHWLSSKGHAAMTGGTALCSDKIDEAFSAWNGYISGTNLKLIKPSYIKQSWRTTEFDELDEDSVIELKLSNNANGCLLLLKHYHIPQGQTQYEQGWKDHYLQPMQQYFMNYKQ